MITPRSIWKIKNSKNLRATFQWPLLPSLNNVDYVGVLLRRFRRTVVHTYITCLFVVKMYSYTFKSTLNLLSVVAAQGSWQRTKMLKLCERRKLQFFFNILTYIFFYSNIFYNVMKFIFYRKLYCYIYWILL